jgi:hypothetical protein
MAHDVRGLYRTPGFAFVTDDTMTLAIPEEEYRTSEYTPDYDDLPSKSGSEPIGIRFPLHNLMST